MEPAKSTPVDLIIVFYPRPPAVRAEVGDERRVIGSLWPRLPQVIIDSSVSEAGM